MYVHLQLRPLNKWERGYSELLTVPQYTALRIATHKKEIALLGDTSLQITKMTTARSARSALSFLLPTLHSGLFCHQLSGNSRSLFFSAVSKETVFHLSPSVNLKSNETVDRWLHVACYGALPFLQGKHEGSPDKNWQMKKVLNDKYYENVRKRWYPWWNL